MSNKLQVTMKHIGEMVGMYVLCDEVLPFLIFPLWFK